MKYSEQIKHPNWQRKRLEVLEHYNFTCQECAETEKELHVHHPFYKTNVMIWDYATGELMCLCCDCHKEAHSIDDKIKIQLSVLSFDQKKLVLNYTKTFKNKTEFRKFYFRIKTKMELGEL
jgi:hypothetical protein